MAIVSADGVGYSRLMAADEHAALAALDDARIAFRTRVAEHRGRVVDTAGDSVLAVFDSASAAAIAALTVQRDLDVGEATTHPAAPTLRFRIGIHTGEVIERADGSVYGHGVNVAARIQSLAEPGCIFVSATVRDLLQRGQPQLLFEDRGSHTVHNIASPIHVFRVWANSDWIGKPPPGSRPERRAAATNLPLPPDFLLGRERAISELTEFLAAHRLITLIGSGGVGKTSVATALVRECAHRFADGVVWVDLSAVSESASVLPVIAASFGVQLGSYADAPNVARALASFSMLIVLDNCEHVVSEVASVAGAILAQAPKVRLLATSQQSLRVPGEQVYRLEGLATARDGMSLQQAREFPAIALLEQRARAADQRFSLDQSTVAAAIELCRRLDGVALAIEMAAARLPALGFVHVSPELFSLTNASRVGPSRQKSLRATLEWSYRLLNEDERTVLRRLSAFVGTFDLDLARRVAGGEGLGQGVVADAVLSLADKSLIQVQRSEPPSYRLLMSTRKFAEEQLERAGEADATARRHGTAMAAIASEAEQSCWVIPEDLWMSRHTPYYGELQAAFDRAAVSGDAHVAGATGEILLMIENRWALSGPQPGRINAAVRLLGSADPQAKGRLWNCIASSTLGVGPRDLGRLHAAESRVSAWQLLGNKEQTYLAFGILAIEQARSGKTTAAYESLTAMHALADDSWSARRIWDGKWRAAHVHEFAGDAAGCVAARRECVEIAEAAGDDSLAALSRVGLAEAALLLGDVETVLQMLPALVERFRSKNEIARLGWALDLFCAGLSIKGDVEGSRAAGKELLQAHRSHGGEGWAFVVVALHAAGLREYRLAAQLLGFARAWFIAREIVPEPIFEHLVRMASHEIEVAAGASELVRFLAVGSALGQDRAYELAAQVLH